MSAGTDWLGELPSHWAITRVGALGTLVKGRGGSKQDNRESGVPVVRYGDLYSKHGIYIDHPTAYVEAETSEEYTDLPFGSVVFAASGESAEEIGKAALSRLPGRCVVGGDSVVLRLSGDVDDRFVVYALDSLPLRSLKAIRATGFTVVHISSGKLKTLPMPLPPLPEQRAIADYLDRETAKIDTLIEEQQRLVEMLRERRAAVVDASLEPTDGWTRCALKMMLAGVDQGVSPQAEAGLADEADSWGVLKSGAPNRGIFRQEEHKRLPQDFPVDESLAVAPGDLIVSRASGSPDLVGSAAVVGDLRFRLILSDKLFRLRPARGADVRYLYWLMNSRRYRNQVRQAISGAEGLANNLPLSALRRFEVHYPPPEEQRRIAAYLDEQTAKIDALIEESERFVELSRERRSALITAAVTGQIDVRAEAS